MTVAAPGQSLPTARPAAAVAFCPSAPLLVPEVEGRATAETAALRRVCAEAVTAMLALAPEVVLVVGDGAGPGERFGPGDAGDLRGFGVDLELPFDGWSRPGGRRLPLAHTVGAWLLDQASYAGMRIGVGPADLAQLVGDLPPPVGILAVADGSARRSPKAPGYLDEAAQPFDAAVSAALAAGDATTLGALDAGTGERLLAGGVPTWRAVGAALAGRNVAARLLFDGAPLGVGYAVAHWVVA